MNGDFEMRCQRRPKGELEAMWPLSTHHECACCGQILPNGVVTHHDDDVGGYVCHVCGPALQLAEVVLLAPPPTLRSVASRVRRPGVNELEGLWELG